MKKIYFIACIMAFCGSFAFSQVLTSPHPTLDYAGPDSAKLHANVTIFNNSSQSLDVICEMYSRNLSPNHYSYFCWVVCYDTSVTISPNPLTIAASGSASNFEGWLGSINAPGHSEVTYRYYDMHGNSDTLYLTFNYDFYAPTGINELNSSKYSLNITGANPTNSYTTISYNLSNQKDARIIVSNLLGSKVSEIRLDNKTNSMTVPVTDLKSGLYIYSLMVDGRIVSSKKLIVAHQ